MDARIFLLAATVAVGLAAARAAAEPANDPIISAYQAYQAADQRGDLPAAEAAAAQALAASEARDGGGGSTAVLAMNLAIVRMEMGHKADALAPARRALDLAERGAKGVDPLVARLMIVEATFAMDPNADENGALTVLRGAETRDADIDVYAYPAAVALGTAALKDGRWSTVVTAWQAAVRHIGGAGGGSAILKSDALVYEALGLIAEHKDTAAAELLDQALAIIAPLAPEAPDWSPPTPLETRYAEIRAWRMAVGARHDVEGLTPALQGENRSQAERPQLPGKPPLCPGKVEPNGALDFPEMTHNPYELTVGAGVVRLQIDKSGAVSNSVVLAAVPRPEFLRALAAPAVKWSFIPDRPTPAGCRLISNDLVLGVVFRPTP